jgi:cell pole-organizing protein PopZ
MVGAASPQHEPTMEEILASIRKIISEDSSEAKEADVLELTQEVREEPPPMAAPAPVAAAPAPAPAAAAPAPVQPAPVQDDVVFASSEEKTVSSPARAESADHEGIFSDKARKAIDDAFAGLDDVEEPKSEAPRAAPAPASAPSADGNSIEAVFERAVQAAVGPLLTQWMDGRKDELLASVKPLIREWMDEHFPALLEGAVRDEVARVVKARGKR